MSEMNRREALTLIALAPFAAAQPASAASGAALSHRTAASPTPSPRFLTAHEWATVSVLADLVIPADARSGSATQAGVPEFIDFMLADSSDDAARTAFRGGLAWMDGESRRRHGKRFVEASPAEQTGILDDIAWPARARPEMSHGVAFFNRFRDLVASGFWSSKMGVADLQYQGNTMVAEWEGCPPDALQRLGVRYDD